jgi:transcriptional regulator with XRE-family HTH domain
MLSLPTMKNILENIRILRETKGYSQEYMAALIKVTQPTYARFERGATKTDLKMLSLIAQALEMNLIDVITYPEQYVNIKEISKEISTSEPEVMLQIKVTGEQKNQILKTAFEGGKFEIS